MELQPFDTAMWQMHSLHPKSMSVEAVEWIFLTDLLNFSFFSDETNPERQFYVTYQGEKFTGYWSLCAAVNRALDAGIPITSPRFWIEAEEDILRDVFRGEGIEPMPLLYCPCNPVLMKAMKEYIVYERLAKSYVGYQPKRTSFTFRTLTIASLQCLRKQTILQSGLSTSSSQRFLHSTILHLHCLRPQNLSSSTNGPKS